MSPSADSSIRIVFTGDSGSATSAVRRVEGAFGGLGRTLKRVGLVVGGIAIAGLAIGLRKAGQAALDFDKGMRNVNSIAKLSEGQLKKVQKQVLALAGPTAQAPKTLAAGLYDIVSSGFDAADAVKILAVTAKAATAGLTDTATSTKAIVAVLNAYKLKASDARAVSDVLFQTVNKGVLTFEELSTSIGDVLPFAAQLSVPIEAVGGAMATMTLQGLSAAESSTRLKGLLVSMLKPTKELAGTLDDLGFASGEAMLKQKGLVGTVDLLDKAARGNKQTIAEWFPNIRALGGFLALSGKQMDVFTESTRSMDSASKGAGATAEAFAEQSKSLSFQWERAKQSLTAAAIPLVTLLFPALVKGAQAVGSFAAMVTAKMPQIKAGFQGFLEPIRAVIDSVIGSFRDLGGVISGIGAGGGLSKFFRDAESTGRLFGSMLVGAVAGLIAFKVATLAATVASLGLGVAVRRIPLIGLISLAVGAATAVGVLRDSMDETRTAFDDAVDAINGYQSALSGLNDQQGQLRDANLAVEQSELGVTAAIRARNSLLAGLTGKERDAARSSLEYRQAQLGVREAYAALDRAEKSRVALLDQIASSEQTAVEKTRAFKQALLDQIATYSDAEVAAGLLAADMAGFVDIAKKGTPEMKLWAGAVLYLAQTTKKVPKQIDIMTALADADTKKKIKELLRSLGILGEQKPKPKVDLDHGPYKRKKREVETGLTALGGKTAKPKTFLEAAGFWQTARGVDAWVRKPSTKNIYINTITRAFRRMFAAGGFVPGGGTGDTVPAMLTPGELVLNRGQQEALGGPRHLASVLGLSAPTPAGGVQAFAAGGFVSGFKNRLKRSAKRDKKHGYQAKLKAVEGLQRRLDRNRENQDRMDRSIGQDDREFSISVEEFIKVDDNGNETLDTAAVQARLGEIDKLVARKNALMALIDEETGILSALIAALDAAVKAYQAEIRDQQRVIREMTELIKDATAKMATGPEEAKPAYQAIISTAENRRTGARSKIDELHGLIDTARGDRRGFQSDRRDQPLDRRDVSLDVQELMAERSEVASIKARPPEPTSDEAMAEAESAGADVGGGSAVQDDLQAVIDALREELAKLRLALGIERAQVPVIGAFAHGTLHVPQTGLALVHAGERIVPANVARAQGGDGGSIEQVQVELSLTGELGRFVDARVLRSSDRVSLSIGREADRRRRSGTY